MDAYESSHIYKERTKKWYDKKLMRREFHIGDYVLLFNSRLKLFPGKLRPRWYGPFRVTKVFPYGLVEVTSEVSGLFKVNGRHLKQYVTGDPIEGKQVYFLSLPPTAT